MRDLKVEGLYAVGQTEGRGETVGDRIVYNRVGVSSLQGWLHMARAKRLPASGASETLQPASACAITGAGFFATACE